MRYLPHDNELLRGIQLLISRPTIGINVPFFGGFALPRTPVEFQFPPKIVSDGRKGTWDEGEIIGTDPISVLATAGPRTMSMKWTYIVDEIGNDSQSVFQDAGNVLFGNTFPWTIARIKKNINLLRGYFLTAKQGFGRGSFDTHGGLVAILNWPLVAGRGSWTCRITSVDVQSSENLVGNRNVMYPVKSDVTIDIKLWTSGITTGESESEKVQNVIDLKPLPDFNDMWY